MLAHHGDTLVHQSQRVSWKKPPSDLIRGWTPVSRRHSNDSRTRPDSAGTDVLENNREEAMTALTRRTLVTGAATLASSASWLAPSRAPAQITPSGGPLPQVKALVFDTFGTVVDWRSGVACESEKILKPLGYQLDWFAFAEA